MMRLARRGTIFLLTAFLLTSVLARIASADDHDSAQRLQESGDIVPLEQILERALRIHPGRVIEVELEREGRYRIYEIEIVDRHGVVWELEFDAGNGRLLENKREH